MFICCYLGCMCCLLGESLAPFKVPRKHIYFIDITHSLAVAVETCHTLMSKAIMVQE